MARFAFATFGSLGDLHPVFALADEVMRRGHGATIATSEYYRDRIQELGARYAPLRPHLTADDPDLVRRIMNGPSGTEFLLRQVIIPSVRDMLDDLIAATRDADLLIASELIYAAPLLVAVKKVRWVSYTLAPLSYFSVHDPCIPPVSFAGEWMHRMPAPIVRGSNRFADLLTRPWWRPIRDLRRHFGLPPGENPLFAGKHSPLLDLALFSSELQPPQPDWPTSTRQTGFCFFDGLYDPLPVPVQRFLSAGEPPIIFTLGSAAVFSAGNFYQESARAAQLLGRRALLLLGSNPPPPDLPASILAWDYLPYTDIFPAASVVVHQGGVGTTAQALRAGRPMLVVPFAHDQFDNAARMTRRGVGRTLRRQRYRAETVAPLLAQLLADAKARSLGESISTKLREDCALELTADALENALSA